MENFYTAYKKTIDGVTFYFVKKYQIFPEYENIPSILENYGMHTNFKKACKIAMISNKTTQQQLLDILGENDASTKVIQINRNKTNVNYRQLQINVPSVLKLIGVR
ncbi:MAG: hypothetical protein ABJA71_05275 [Ginsengibacter sp.]